MAGNEKDLNENILKDHETRITKLEKSDIEKEIRLHRIEDNYTRLENTILNENRETRDILREGMKNQWELIKSRDEKNEAQSAREYDLKKTRVERYSEIALKLLTAGGIVYLLIQSFLQ